MNTDENAPPSSKDEKPTSVGLMSSPFGFLAGVRAMLSPAVKDPLSESPIVSGRPALRDANASTTPNNKNYLTGVRASLSPIPNGTGCKLDGRMPCNIGVCATRSWLLPSCFPYGQ